MDKHVDRAKAIDKAFETVKADNNFIFSSRYRNTKDIQIKLVIIKMYEDLTGKKVLDNGV